MVDRRIFFAMPEVGEGELRRVVELLGDLATLETAHPFEERVLSRLRDLVPSVDASYVDLDRIRRVTIDATASSTVEGTVSDELYFSYWHECPTRGYRDRIGDSSAMRIADLLSERQWHELGLYRECFRPLSIDHPLEIGFRAPPGRERVIALWHEHGSRDFSDRDRATLDLLRPHLAQRLELAELRRRVSATLVEDGELTPREREILGLVAEGMTNAQIAAILWIAPSTVKKHLENIYGKLCVPGRAAAVARLQRVPTDPDLPRSA